MTCRDDVGTTGPDKSESKRYLLVPNCFLGNTCSTQNWIIFGESDMVSEDFAHKVMGDLSNFEGLSKNDLKVILKEGKRWSRVGAMGKKREGRTWDVVL